MPTRISFKKALFICLFAGLPTFAAQGNEAPLLDDYLLWSIDHSPELGAAQHEMTSRIHVAEAAGALPDLKLGWSEMLVPVETRVGPQQRAFSIAQPIPWFGTLGLKREVGLQQAAVAQFRLHEVEQRIGRQVRQLWFELALAQAQQHLTGEVILLAEENLLVTQSSYESGQATFRQLMAVQQKLESLRFRLDDLTDRQETLHTQLHLLAGNKVSATLPRAHFSFPPFDRLDLDDRSHLYAALDQNNPALLALRQEMAVSHTRQKLAGMVSRPDLSVGLDYIMTGSALNPELEDSGKDPVIARLQVNIPLWGGRSAGEKAAASEQVWKANSALDDQRLKLKHELDEALYQYRSADRELELLENSLLPRSKRQEQAVRASYESGQASRVDLMELTENILDLEWRILEATYAQSMAKNQVFYLLGGEVQHMDFSPQVESDK